MRPAPPRGAVFAQLSLSWAEFHEDKAPAVLPPGPSPSACPTVALMLVDCEVQSLHVFPGISVPSAVEPVRMSCSTGDGDPGHCPLIRRPFSSTNSEASPVREWSSPTFLATSTPLALRQGPMPIRLRASTGPPPLAGSWSALRYARHSWPPAPAAVANRWHMASAPLRPPRFPVVLRELETKKVIGPLGFEGIVLSFAPQLATRTQSKTGDHFFIARLEKVGADGQRSSALRRPVPGFLPDRLRLGRREVLEEPLRAR